MITSLTNKEVWTGKRNWIDQNDIVVGYDEDRQCCEDFGWGVYNAETKERLQDDPAGLLYHFGDADTDVDFDNALTDLDGDSNNDIIHIELLPDDGKSPKLILEFYNCHNGYYHHDFSIKRTVEQRNQSKDIVKELTKKDEEKLQVIKELNEVRELNRKCCDENDMLKGLVKELADDLSGYLCESECNGACASFGHCCNQTSRQIIAKAREVVK